MPNKMKRFVYIVAYYPTKTADDPEPALSFDYKIINAPCEDDAYSIGMEIVDDLTMEKGTLVNNMVIEIPD